MGQADQAVSVLRQALKGGVEGIDEQVMDGMGYGIWDMGYWIWDIFSAVYWHEKS